MLQFTINPLYQAAVNAFEWLETGKREEVVLSEQTLEATASAVAQQIISSSQIQPTVSMMARRELSLLEMCLYMSQELDKQNHTQTPIKIFCAFRAEKIVLNEIYAKLSPLFTQVVPDVLKKAILLFGIHAAHQIANPLLSQIPQETTSQIEQMEKDLNELRNLRNRISAQAITASPDEVTRFFADVDAKIVETEQQLALLRQKVA